MAIGGFHRRCFGIRHSLFLVLLSGCTAANSVAPPRQPGSGPGGADYKHAGVLVQEHGSGDEAYWLFFPDHPRPAEAPFVVFLHGWSGMNPRIYGGWIKHLVRKGHIVLYPKYQSSLLVPIETMEAAASQAIKDAWSIVHAEGPVRPSGQVIAWIGHSLGGVFALKFAAEHAELGLPSPGALLIVEPGGETRVDVTGVTQLSTSARVLFVVGEDDDDIGQAPARYLMELLWHMPRENVQFVTIRSDRRSTPPLIADHFAPTSMDRSVLVSGAYDDEDDAGGQIGSGLFGRLRRASLFGTDALDYYGFWKLGDGLLDATFRGENLEYAFGNTPQQRFMGLHSDGTPVTQLTVEGR